MGDFVDHYAVLGLREDDDGVKISKEEIRKAYLCKALKYHPDKNRDDPKKAQEKFRKIKTSYDILIDPNSKELFDNLLRTKLKKQKSKRNRDHEDSKFWNNIPEKEKEKPKRTQGDPEFWKKVIEEEKEEEEEEEEESATEFDCDSEAFRHEKETLRELYKQVKEIRVSHAKKREKRERFVNDIPKANPRFLFRRKFSMAEFVSYEAMVLRRVQEAAGNYKRSSSFSPSRD